MISIEWQQLLTHALGFLIFFWVLKKYAWGPLLNLLDERRSKIVDQFEQIELEKETAAKLNAEYEAKLRDIDNERRAEIVKAVDEGKKVASEMKSAAQQEAKEIAEKNKKDLEREVAKAKVQLRDEMVAMTMSAAEKVIHERLDDAKHRELIDKFIANLEKA
jgi:F-type H+-transporting ATPase subunit b